MSCSPSFIVSHTKEVEEEELLAIDQGRSRTSSPRSRPNSRLEILMMDLVRSQTEMARSQEERARSTEQKLESLARAQSEQSKSTEGKLDGLARSTEGKLDGLARSTEGKLDEFARGHAAELANIVERISSVEKSLHGIPSSSPILDRRGSSPSAETINVSVPSTSGYLVPLFQSQVRRR